MNMGKLTLDEIKSLIDDEPNNAEHYQELGKYHLRKDEFEDAEKYLKISLELNCDDVWTYLFMGNLYYQKNRYNEAIGYYEQSVKLQPGEPTGHWCLAEMYERLGEYETANKYFKRAVDVAPENETAVNKWRVWSEWYLKH